MNRKGTRRIIPARGMPWLLPLLLCLLSLPAFAADKPISAFHRETWTTRNGLPHNQVNAIAQTPDGYLWLGTWEGLVRYNGREFEVLDRINTPALQDNAIRSLQVAPDGAVVIGTSRGGVTVRRGDRWSTIRKQDGLAQDEILDALVGPDGALWVATENEGITRLQRGVARQYNTGNGLPSNVVFGLLKAADGAVWAATAGGVVRFRNGRLQPMPAASGLPPAPAFKLLESSRGVLYVGTEKGLYRRIGKQDRFELASALLPMDAVINLAEDSAGNLWVSTENNGLLRLGPNGVESLSLTRERQTRTRVPSVFVDRDGGIWAGSIGGLIHLSDAPFTTWNQDQGLSDDYVRSVLETRDGKLLIGTSRGLNVWQDNRVAAVYSKATGLPSDSILSLLELRDGSILAGTYGNGVLHLRAGRLITHYENARGMPGSNQVRALAEAADGTLWIGTTRGLLRLRDGRFQLLGVRDGLPREFIISLKVAADGSLWVGTSNGAARIKDGVVRPVAMDAALQAQDIFDFHEDPDGTMWMASDRGLLRYRNGEMRALGIANGLPVDTVFAVVDDGLGRFWLTSNRGVMRVARKDVGAVMDGRARITVLDHFGEADGLVSAQCNGGSGPVALRDRSGDIWVATSRGAAVVSPASLNAYRRTLPRAILEQVLADNVPIPTEAPARLPAGTRKLEFRYAAPSFQMSQFLHYRHRLIGVDADWVALPGRNGVQYTNLGPGDYTFEVDVSAPGLGHGWSGTPAMMQMTIAPRPWQRRGVQAAAVAAAALLLFGLMRWRTRRLRIRAHELEQVVAERTHDLQEHARRLDRSDAEKTELLIKLQDQARAFERMALEDALTGIGNRRSLDAIFRQAFERVLRNGRPLCVALLDVDGFKQINDRYSHAVGDWVLVTVAHAIRDALDGAGQVARWGGEEFAIVFERVPPERCLAICENIRRQVEAIDCSAKAPGLQVTISIGLAERGLTERPEDLVAKADALLYEAKRSGRNRVAG